MHISKINVPVLIHFAHEHPILANVNMRIRARVDVNLFHTNRSNIYVHDSQGFSTQLGLLEGEGRGGGGGGLTK